MIIKQHDDHMTIEGDEDLLQLAGIEITPTPLRKDEPPINFSSLRWLYEQAKHKKTRDAAALYVISRANYLHQIDQRKQK
ncbi:hypothetical protein [Bacillus cereus]|uniref:hypothetical protein n=1 Tax=Bacillus TaxID=1386 RepID=UPI000BFD9581|nr:hypothetical protein [Bacillus cereus]MCU5440507.1 hypothetical protein [Bacillus cereus]MRC15535.1 hypothetical protein [Bacillus thuringiensis]PGZ17218.1 hypothetical protein COE46_09545 [Bacillus cereus]